MPTFLGHSNHSCSGEPFITKWLQIALLWIIYSDNGYCLCLKIQSKLEPHWCQINRQVNTAPAWKDLLHNLCQHAGRAKKKSPSSGTGSVGLEKGRRKHWPKRCITTGKGFFPTTIWSQKHKTEWDSMSSPHIAMSPSKDQLHPHHSWQTWSTWFEQGCCELTIPTTVAFSKII